MRKHCDVIFTKKNDVGFREFILSLELTPADRDRLFMLTELRGGVAVLDQAAELVYSQEGKQSVNELRRLWQVLIDEGLDSHSIIDLSVVLHMEYYTGCVFEIYHEKNGSTNRQWWSIRWIIREFWQERLCNGIWCARRFISRGFKWSRPK